MKNLILIFRAIDLVVINWNAINELRKDGWGHRMVMQPMDKERPSNKQFWSYSEDS